MEIQENPSKEAAQEGMTFNDLINVTEEERPPS